MQSPAEMPGFFIYFWENANMPAHTYPNTSGIIDLTPATLSGLGITLAPGDTLNINTGTFQSIKGTGLNGTALNPIVMNFATGTHVNRSAYTSEKELIDCAFLVFTGIDTDSYTNGTFCTIGGNTHDITWIGNSFSGFTDQHAFEIGKNGSPKAFNGTKGSTYYNLKWINNVFDGLAGYGGLIHQVNSISLDCEVAGNTFTNVTAPGEADYPHPIYFWGYGWKIHHNTFSNIGNQNVHLACIQYYGYADIYSNIFSNQLANDVRCFPLKLNFTGYLTGKNRFWNNISHDKLKYSMFEVNTNNQNDKETDGTGYHIYNDQVEIMHNTMVRSRAGYPNYTDDVKGGFQGNLVDFYCASGIVKGNLIISPETDRTFNSGRNYAYSLDNSGVTNGTSTHTGTITQQYNFQAATVNPANFNDTTFTPVAGGALLNNVPEDFAHITTDYYGNPRKVGAASDAGAVELQAAGPNTNPIAYYPNVSITLPTTQATLDSGSSFDPDGSIASVLWSLISGPNTPTIVTPTGATTLVTGLVPGTYVFDLTVTDNLGGTNSYGAGTLTVNAAPNVPPVANAGADRNITLPTNTTTLDGSASTDGDGTISSYSWAKISGPVAGTLVSPNSAVATLNNATAGVYVFRLTVTDNNGDTDTDDMTVTVNAAPAPEINVFGGRPNGVIAKQTVSFASAGISTANTRKIFLLDAELKSYDPNRAINGITGFVIGKSYYWVAITDMDKTAYVYPPIP